MHVNDLEPVSQIKKAVGFNAARFIAILVLTAVVIILSLMILRLPFTYSFFTSKTQVEGNDFHAGTWETIPTETSQPAT